MRDGRFVGRFARSAFRIGMNPLVVAGSLRKQVHHCLRNGYVLSFAKRLPGMGRKVGQVSEGLHAYCRFVQFCRHDRSL